MRVIKMSKKEFSTLDKLERFFTGIGERELWDRGFLFPSPRVKPTDPRIGEWLLFSFQNAVRYVARAASTRLDSKETDDDRYHKDRYPYYFLVDLDSIRPANLSTSDLQGWLDQRMSPITSLKGTAWTILPDELAEELLRFISESLPKVDAAAVEEGLQEERTGAFRQRNAGIVKTRLQRDNYTCQVCRFQLIANGHPIIECHHLLSLDEGVRTTHIDDLASLCPTCHRIAHTRRPSFTLSEIKQLRNLH